MVIWDRCEKTVAKKKKKFDKKTSNGRLKIDRVNHLHDYETIAGGGKKMPKSHTRTAGNRIFLTTYARPSRTGLSRTGQKREIGVFFSHTVYSVYFNEPSTVKDDVLITNPFAQ